MKIFKAIIATILCFGMLSVFIGCDSSEGINTDSLLTKDNIGKALMRYEENKVKKSDFSYSVKLSMFSDNKTLQTEKDVREISIGQTLSGSRIENEGKLYLDVNLFSSGVNANLLNAVSFAKNLSGVFSSLIGGEEDLDLTVPDEVMKYVKTQSFFKAKIGYENGTYNALGDYCMNDETADFKINSRTVWGATTDSEISKFAKDGLDSSMDVKFNELAMSLPNTFELATSADWITGDTAGENYNADEGCFLYDLTINKDKIRDDILGGFNSVAESLDPEEWAEGVATYNLVMETTKKWINVYDGKLKAKVHKDGYLMALDTQMVIEVNINIEELIGLLTALQEEDEFKDIITILETPMIVGFFAGASKDAGSGIWSIRLNLSTTETFSYDEASVDLSGVDKRLYESFETENEERYKLKYRSR